MHAQKLDMLGTKPSISQHIDNSTLNRKSLNELSMRNIHKLNSSIGYGMGVAVMQLALSVTKRRT
jgi:acetylglutamate synthase